MGIEKKWDYDIDKIKKKRCEFSSKVGMDGYDFCVKYVPL